MADRSIESGRVVHSSDSMREPQLGGEPRQRVGAPSGEERPEAARDGAARDQFSGVAGGSIENEIHRRQSWGNFSSASPIRSTS